MSKIKELEQEIKDIKAAMVDDESKEMLAEPLEEAKRQLEIEKKAASQKHTPEIKSTSKKRVISKAKKEGEDQKKEEAEEKRKKTEEKKHRKEAEEKRVKAEKENRVKEGEKEHSSGNKELDKAVKKAVITLNKRRYKLVEVLNKQTGKKEQAHHTPEYRNSRIIKSRVEKIFNSSIYDISNSKEKKKKNAEIVEKAEQLKDLFTILLNEIDAIINSTDSGDIDNILNLIKGLVKESLKNDPKDKYEGVKYMQDLISKYKI